MKKLIFAVFFFVLFGSLAFALDAPEITTPESGIWHSGNVYVRWNPVSDSDGYAYLFDESPDTVMDSVTECLANNSKTARRADGVWYFHVAACDGNERSETTHLEIKSDSTPPTRVEGLTVEPTEDGKMKLSWQESTDNYSGISHYILYRNRFFDFAIGDLATTKIDNVLGTEYIDTDVEERGYYNYKISAVDTAGTRGLVTLMSKGARTLGKCDFNVNISLDFNFGQDVLAITVSAEGTMYDINLYVKEPDADFVSVLSEDALDEVSHDFDLSGKTKGVFEVKLEALDNDEDSCTAQESFTYDNTKPSINWVSLSVNERVKSEKEIIFEVSDAGFSSGLKEVKLFFGSDSDLSEIQTSEDNGRYSYTFDPSGHDSGYYKFKATVEDNSGNKEESEISFKVVNVESEEKEVNDKLEETETKLAEAKTNIAFAELLGINPETYLTKISEAEDALVMARESADANEYSNAIADAETALFALKEIEETLSFSEYSSDEFSFNRPKLGELLLGAGLSEASLTEAGTFFDSYAPIRKLVLTEVILADENYFVARIILEANAVDTNEHYFYEVLPKDIFTHFGQPLLAEGQQKISDEPFVIKGTLTESGEVLQASYIFSDKLTKEDADSAVSNKLIQKYSVPTIVFDETAVSLKTEFSNSMFLLMVLGGIGLVLVFLILFVVVLILIYRKFLLKKRRPKLGL